jgi:hypothetical protein
MRDYFHTLVVRQKWHTEKRNVQVGDVVLLQDSNNIRGQWKLAQIVEATPGMDGKVRDVKNQIQEYRRWTSLSWIPRLNHELIRSMFGNHSTNEGGGGSNPVKEFHLASFFSAQLVMQRKITHQVFKFLFLGGGSLSCHTCCNTGSRFSRSHPKDRPSYDKQRDGIMLRLRPRPCLCVKAGVTW